MDNEDRRIVGAAGLSLSRASDNFSAAYERANPVISPLPTLRERVERMRAEDYYPSPQERQREFIEKMRRYDY